MVGINTNLSALNARQSLDANAVNQANTMQQLSTGLRINSAKDDAAGLAISTVMNSNIRGVAVAVRNVSDGISMAQTAESALGSVTNMLQRMRELAVQASNGTLTSANRASMQLEVNQLASEIDNISKTTNFNGIKLLDGSASNIVLQTNINADDTIKIAIEAINNRSLGGDSLPAINSFGWNLSNNVVGGGFLVWYGNRDMPYYPSGISSQKGINTGDLIINGVTINSSLAGDDDSSIIMKESSSISKVAAINRESAHTGVIATVNETIVSGIEMTQGTVGAAGTITINGITTHVINLVGNKAQDRSQAVAAINAISGATGVTAIDTQDEIKGVQLIAKDGRNIATYGTGNFNASDIGVDTFIGGSNNACNVFIGTYNLRSTTNAPIILGTTVSGKISNSGFVEGTYAANTIYAMGTKRAGMYPIDIENSGLRSGDLVINGIAMGDSMATDDAFSVGMASYGRKDTSAISIAAAINKHSSQTGVKAIANANIFVGSGLAGLTQETATSGMLTLNGIQISLVTLQYCKPIDIIDQINAYTGATGVIASDNGDGITLTAEDGRNIEIEYNGSANSHNLGLVSSLSEISAGRFVNFTGTVLASSISLVSDKSFTVSTGTRTNSLANITRLGFSVGTFGGSEDGAKIADVDISTEAGSQQAIRTVDMALSQVSDQRSNLGSIQNRLQSAAENLFSNSTNLQAAQSRIQDTDYSISTTQLSKSQIIAQAATTILAQANQQPQLVLSLLKN